MQVDLAEQSDNARGNLGVMDTLCMHACMHANAGSSWERNSPAFMDYQKMFFLKVQYYMFITTLLNFFCNSIFEDL